MSNFHLHFSLMEAPENKDEPDETDCAGIWSCITGVFPLQIVVEALRYRGSRKGRVVKGRVLPSEPS